MPEEPFTYQEVQNIIDGIPVGRKVYLTLDQLFLIKQIRYLEAINNKITFFMIVVIFGIMVMVLQSCL